jgi:hypothetical protein
MIPFRSPISLMLMCIDRVTLKLGCVNSVISELLMGSSKGVPNFWHAPWSERQALSKVRALTSFMFGRMDWVCLRSARMERGGTQRVAILLILAQRASPARMMRPRVPLVRENDYAK